MGMKEMRRLARATPALLVAALLAGCLGEKVVYKDRDLFTTPPPAAEKFVGYTDVSTKLAVCGNCHVDHQGKWQETKHAEAWADLEASGHANDSCRACHTVNGNGNAADNPAGWVAVQDERYQDVQCESCHGAGLDHVSNPESGVPLAPMSVGLDLTTGCGECHNGTHHPFVEEWAQSAHGAVPNQGHTGDNPSCQGCHTGEGALAAWGIETNYLEKDQLGEGNHLAITCAICHDPHELHQGVDHQLRFSVETPSVEENLCMKCHHKRGVPDPTTFRGAHSPEGPVLLGEAGWIPPGTVFPGGKIVATHGSEANPKLCAGCHVNRFEVTDPETGSFAFQATGHLFTAIPCLDPDTGLPTTGDCPVEDRSFEACTASGCHGNQDVARSLMATAETRIDDLANQLDAMLEQLQPGWKTCRAAAGGCGPFVIDSVYTTAEGAGFNYDLAEYPGSAIHNPFLMEALLTASIKQVTKDYGVPAGNIVLENLLQSH